MTRDRVVGRGPELTLVDRFLERLRGDPAAFVIEGEPGIGKTALWREAVARAQASGLRVVRAMPAESEARLSYSALGDLVGTAFDEAGDALPSPQQQALAVALLRTEPPAGTDQRLVATALLGVLDRLTAGGPVLVAIDDVPWLDRASARALEFAARRARGPIGWLLTRRGTDFDRLPLGLEVLAPDSVQRVVPGPLSLAALHHLLMDRHEGEVSRPLLQRIQQASGGNPFLALELARAVSSSQGRSLADPLPVPERLQALLSTRLRSLSPAAVDVVRLVALLAQPSPAAVRVAVDDSAAARAGLLEAEEAGVIVEVGPRLRFTHPLLAASVLSRLSPERLRQLHQRLAAVVSDSEQRARHLALGSAEPNAPTAAVIERAAAEAARRGAQDAAAELFEAAWRVTPEDDLADGARRLAGAAGALLAAVDIRGARTFGERALALAPRGAVRAEVLHVLAQVAWLDSPLPTVVRTLEEALSEPNVARASRARMHARLAAYQVAAPSVAHAVAAAQLLDEEQDPALLSHVLLARFWADAMLNHGADRSLLERALALEERGGIDVERSTIPLIYFQSADEQEAARSRCEVDEIWFRQRGEDGWVAERRAHLAWLELRAGNWDLADELIEDSCTVVGAGRSGAWLIPFVVRSFIDVHRGRFDRARETLSSLLEESGADAGRWFASIAHFVLAFLEYSLGSHEACLNALELMAQQHAALGIEDAPPDRSQPFHVESLLALGRLDQAREVLDRLEQRARVWPRLWIDLALPRTRAVVLAAEGDVESALTAIDQVDRQAAAQLPFEQAWTLLVEGRLHRRAKHKRLAGLSLQQAVELFEQLGAPTWAAQAREELGRTGHHHSEPQALTATERRISELVASGLSNPQVAQAAFVSRKTVEANLTSVYRKLSIQSRHQLAARLAQLPREDLPDT